MKQRIAIIFWGIIIEWLVKKRNVIAPWRLYPSVEPNNVRRGGNWVKPKLFGVLSGIRVSLLGLFLYHMLNTSDGLEAIFVTTIMCVID